MEYIPDEKDILILDVLCAHGDYTVRQIAKKTLLPPTTIHNRIARLKKAGIVERFTIDVDKKKLGLNIGAYLLLSADLKLLKEKKKTQRDLAAEIRRLPGVEKADMVAGTANLIATVRVKNVDELDRALLARMQLLEGVSKIQTMIIIHD